MTVPAYYGTEYSMQGFAQLLSGPLSVPVVPMEYVSLMFIFGCSPGPRVNIRIKM